MASLRRRHGTRAVAWTAGLALAACHAAPRPVVVPPPPAPTPIPTAPVPVAKPAEGTIAVGGAGALYYRVVGRAADTVLVPLGVFLDSALAPLASSHTLVFYDPRQRGRSTHYSDTTLSTFAADADDIERVREELGISRMSLIGFSYFAAVTVSYASTHPQRVTRLALLPIEPTDSSPSVATHTPQWHASTRDARQLVRWRAAGRDTSDAQAYCRAYWAMNAPVYVGDTAHAGRVRTDQCALPNEAIRAFSTHVAQVLRSIGPRRDFTSVAAGVTCPTLILHGDQDLVAYTGGARAWAASIPTSRLLTVPGGGHFVFDDDPSGVVNALAAFLGQGWPPGAAAVR
ncbi:MAG: alpha/beta hydrolase [Gemmatimonadaceae bacterium]